jgi:hypothetical protein
MVERGECSLYKDPFCCDGGEFMDGRVGNMATSAVLGWQPMSQFCLPVLDQPFTQFIAIGCPDFRIFERSAAA